MNTNRVPQCTHDRIESAVHHSVLTGIDEFVVAKFAGLIPSCMTGYWLTVLGAFWSAIAIFSAARVGDNPAWILGTSLAILGHYTTDSLDGVIGRKQATPLYRWGFYMDHMLDSVFLVSVFLSYFALIGARGQLPVLLALVGTLLFMVHTFLKSAIFGSLTLSYFRIGPTELQALGIMLNLVVLFCGMEFMRHVFWGFDVFVLIGLIISILQTSSRLKELDQGSHDKSP